MKNAPNIKEKIIEATISLIKHSNGLVENITIRDIAHKANIAIGLVNYHFTSKNNLIETCVQHIIAQTVETFNKKKSAINNITSDIMTVFTYLIKHPEISKISMLADLSYPNLNSNSIKSYDAILNVLPKTETENTRRIKAFILLSIIHSAFLNRQISKDFLGLDLENIDDYSSFFITATEILNIK